MAPLSPAWRGTTHHPPSWSLTLHELLHSVQGPQPACPHTSSPWSLMSPFLLSWLRPWLVPWSSVVEILPATWLTQSSHAASMILGSPALNPSQASVPAVMWLLKYLLLIFAHFLVELALHLWLCFGSTLFPRDTRLVSNVWLAGSFSKPVASIHLGKCLNLMRSICLFFFLG